MFAWAKNAINKVFGDAHDGSKPTANIGSFQYEVGKLREATANAGGDSPLYSLDELQEFINKYDEADKMPPYEMSGMLTLPNKVDENNIKNNYRNAIQQDITYAKSVADGLEKVNPKIKDLETTNTPL